jgi:hypothetical protein
MEPLKQENKVKKLLPPGFYIDRQEDETWDEKDIAKLQRESQGSEKKQPAKINPSDTTSPR